MVFILPDKVLKAAAASAMTFVTQGIYDKKEDESIEFICDRPFIYVLIKNGCPTFIGTMCNPAE